MFSSASLIIVLSVVSMIILSSNPILIMGLVLGLSVGAVIFISWGMSSWFGMMVVIIYIGGMLVMFSYFVALSPNQVFNILPVITMGALSYVIFSAMTMTGVLSGVGPSITETSSWIFYIYSDLVVLILLILVLFLAMVMVTKIVYRSWGALRGV